MNRESIYIFYSWQSDTDNKINNYFIRDALAETIKDIKKSIDFIEDIVLDHDTRNVPGIPQITNTILEKINRCSIFVPDLTYISKTEKGKNIPNPNVLIELGYAIKSIGSERIITVLNEFYGKCIDGLPFDLGHHRWPIVYCLPPNSSPEEIKKEKKSLTNKLKNALKITINEGVVKLNKKDSYARKVVAEIKEELLLSRFSPTPVIDQLNDIYSQLEDNAINGALLDVEVFFNFIKTKYLPEIIKYLNSSEGKGQNYLNYWNRIFSKGGSIFKIKTRSDKKTSDLLSAFKMEMWFSEFVPVQSMEQYDNKFIKLSKKAIDGDVEDIVKFQEFIINDYFPFLRAYTQGNLKTERYLSKWNELFGKEGILKKVENRYKYM